MALTHTDTSTRVYTRSRMSLIRIQLQSFATRFGYTQACIDALPGAVEDQLVTSLAVFAHTASDETLAAVYLQIDWLAHGELRQTTEVQIDSRWRDDVAPQLELFEETFMDFVGDNDLILDRRVGFSDVCLADPALHESTLRRLDLVPGDAIRWRNDSIGQAERVQRLAEVAAGVEFADDEA